MVYFLRLLYVIILGLFICASCNDHDGMIARTKLYNNIEYKLDHFYVFDIYENMYNDYAYTNIHNDTLYLIENYGDDCFMKWKIGYLNTSKKSVRTLNNNCGTSTITDHLISRTKCIDTINDEVSFLFDIKLGTNGDVNVTDSRRKLFYSFSKGIICIIKSDSLKLAPFY